MKGTIRSYSNISRRPFAISINIDLLSIFIFIQTYKEYIDSDSFLRLPNITTKFEINTIIDNIELIPNKDYISILS